MTDLICRKTMMRCQTPGMCSPFGGCQPSALADCKTTQSNTSAAPRQPEGEVLEVVAFYWLDTGYENPNSHGPYFGWPNEDVLRRVDGGAMPIALCRLSDAQRAIAELREECERLRGEVEKKYREPSKNEVALESERDTLRQQLADSDAALRESRANDTAAMGHLADMRQQRDKLAAALDELMYARTDKAETMAAAALAEVK